MTLTQAIEHVERDFSAAIMLVAMIGVIFIGFPISFTLLFLALVRSDGVGPRPGRKPSILPTCTSGAP